MEQQSSVWDFSLGGRQKVKELNLLCRQLPNRAVFTAKKMYPQKLPESNRVHEVSGKPH